MYKLPEKKTIERINTHVRTDILDKLADEVGLDKYGCDLHHYLCNEDYFVIGSYNAKKMLGSDAFDAIEIVQEYEEDNFGEVTTKLSDPEKVVNMLAYIMGEELLNDSDHLTDKWGEALKIEDLNKISEEILTGYMFKNN